MRILLFHNAKDADAARHLAEMIEAHECLVSLADSASVWDVSRHKTPVNLLEGVSHALFLVSDDTADVSAFLFFWGFCLGRGLPVLLFVRAKSAAIPEGLRRLGIVLEPESFEDYFLAEREHYLTRKRKDRARAELLERGISCYEENFVAIVNSGDAEAVRLFLEAGFESGTADTKGTPLLSLAVRAHFHEIVAMLIDAGAEVNRQSGDRHYSPLMDAAQKGDGEMVRLLIERGADVNLRSKDGQTALVICAGRGDVPMARLLVSAGADPAIADNLGMSAIGYAKLFHNAELTELFNTIAP